MHKTSTKLILTVIMILVLAASGIIYKCITNRNGGIIASKMPLTKITLRLIWYAQTQFEPTPEVWTRN